DVAVGHAAAREPRRADVPLEPLGPARVELDRRHLAAEHRRLGPWGGARVEDALAVLRADREGGELRTPALPHAGFPRAVDLAASEPVRARDVGRGPDRDCRADDELGRLALGAPQTERR